MTTQPCDRHTQLARATRLILGHAAKGWHERSPEERRDLVELDALLREGT